MSLTADQARPRHPRTGHAQPGQHVDRAAALAFLASVDVDACNDIAHPENRFSQLLRRLLRRDHLLRTTAAGRPGRQHTLEDALDFLFGLLGDDLAPLMREIEEDTGQWPATEAQIRRYAALARPANDRDRSVREAHDHDRS